MLSLDPFSAVACSAVIATVPASCNIMGKPAVILHGSQLQYYSLYLSRRQESGRGSASKTAQYRKIVMDLPARLHNTGKAFWCLEPHPGRQRLRETTPPRER